MGGGGNMTLMRYLHQARGTTLVVGGHRGHRSDVRENTIGNFRQVRNLGVPYIEIDVQLTADQQIVIFHDAELGDTTPLQGAVRDHTLETLRAHFEINTVDEVLAWAGACGMGIAFELKLYPMYTQTEQSVIAGKLTRAIREFACHDNCFVFGKDYRTLGEIRGLDKEIHIGIIAPGDPAQALPLMEELDAFLYLDFLSGLDKALVDKLHGAGYLVDGSVVDTREDLARALELGVDLIESNEPGWIRSCLAEMDNADGRCVPLADRIKPAVQ